MVRLFLDVDGRKRILSTQAQTMAELQADVEGRLGLRVAELRLGEAPIEDDHDVGSLREDDTVSVIAGEPSVIADLGAGEEPAEAPAAGTPARLQAVRQAPRGAPGGVARAGRGERR